MIVKQMPVGPMANFGYLLGCEETRIGALIDPSFEPEKLVEMAKEIGLKIEWILSTHGHFDHVNGNETVVEMTGAKIAGHSSATFHTDQKLEHGDIIKIGNIPVEVLFTPGHSPDEVCFLVDKQILFTGDVLFVGECGRTDLPGSNPREMYKSLFEVLSTVPDDVDVFPGHDYGNSQMSTMGFERQNNYVLESRTEEEFVAFMKEP